MVAKKTHNCPMSAEEMRELLSELDYSQVGFADLININDATVRRFVGKDAINHDGCLIILLRLMRLLTENPELLKEYSIKELAEMCSKRTSHELDDLSNEKAEE